jgi:hypothetical protein
MTPLSWRPDRKPDSETLLGWYDQLDRQVKEIKNQMKRGVIGPHQVQAFVEHRGEIFPDAFWTITSRGRTQDQLVEDLKLKGWTVEENYFRDVSQPEAFRITTGATYHLVGIQSRRISDRSPFKWRDVLGEMVHRGYKMVPAEAAVILGAQYSRKELGGYKRVYVMHGTSPNFPTVPIVSALRTWNPGNAPYCEEILKGDCGMLADPGFSGELFVFGVDVPEL